jgi:hypothetical protein
MVFVSFPLLAPKPLKKLQAKIEATDRKKMVTFSMEYRAKIACSRTQTSQVSTEIKNYLKKTKASAKKLFELCAQHSSELFKRLAFVILSSLCVGHLPKNGVVPWKSLF